MAKIFVSFLLTLLFIKRSSSVPIDLGNACQNIWNAAGNNLKVPLELKVDTVGKNPLFKLEPAGKTKVDSDVFTTFAKLMVSKTVADKDKFLAEIMKTGGPMEQALNYLNAQMIFSPAKDMTGFRNALEDMWFNPFPGKGFPHVFIGETNSKYNSFSGFHNWYQFYLEQSKGPGTVSSVNVHSFTQNTEPNLMKGLDFKWGTYQKKPPKPPTPPGSSLFVGTSPAFDFALFSVCFTALYNGAGGGGKQCTCSIRNSQLTMTAIEQNKSPGKICTVYPTSVEPVTECTSIHHTARTDCGWLGIDYNNCAERGCCFDNKEYGGGHTYWCFYPSNHQCHGIPPKDRVDCGYPGISRDECERVKGCCFDESIGGGVKHCFHGVPK